jgi:hypothetical protein
LRGDGHADVPHRAIERNFAADIERINDDVGV